MMRFIGEHRKSDTPFDVTVHGTSPGNDLARGVELAEEYSEAGITWWQEAINERRPDLIDRAAGSSWIDAVRWRIGQGPPKL